jgi:hypothetical protein
LGYDHGVVGDGSFLFATTACVARHKSYLCSGSLINTTPFKQYIMKFESVERERFLKCQWRVPSPNAVVVLAITGHDISASHLRRKRRNIER